MGRWCERTISRDSRRKTQLNQSFVNRLSAAAMCEWISRDYFWWQHKKNIINDLFGGVTSLFLVAIMRVWYGAKHMRGWEGGVNEKCRTSRRHFISTITYSHFNAPLILVRFCSVRITIYGFQCKDFAACVCQKIGIVSLFQRFARTDRVASINK